MNGKIGVSKMGIVSANLTKIKASTSVKNLIGENYRIEKDAKHYDDGHRNIDVNATKENDFLIARPENYDRERREKINRVNEARANRPNDDRLMLKKNLKKHGKLKSTNNKNIASHRKLRSDTVDTIGIVIQPDDDFINSLNRENKLRFFRDSLGVIKDNPDYFGVPETAVVHFDETTPHMQVLATTIDEDNLTSNANKIMGNKTKMSKRQDVLVDALKAKGWDVERGMKRVNNPEYQNFKTDMDRLGITVNRYNDMALMVEHEKLKKEMADTETAKAELQNLKNEANKYRSQAKAAKKQAEDYEQKKLTTQTEYQNLTMKNKQLTSENETLKTENSDLGQRKFDVVKREQASDQREADLGVREMAIKGLEDREKVAAVKGAKADRALKKASKKLAEATALKLLAEEMVKEAEGVKLATEKLKQRIVKAWRQTIKRVINGSLQSENIEKELKPYDPLSNNNIDQFTDKIEELAKGKDQQMGL